MESATSSSVISRLFACDPTSGEMLIFFGNKQLQIKGRSWIQMNHFLAGVEQHLPFHYNTDETYQLVKSGRRRKMWLLLGMQNHLLFCTVQEFQELVRFSTRGQCHWLSLNLVLQGVKCLFILANKDNGGNEWGVKSKHPNVKFGQSSIFMFMHNLYYIASV